MRTDIETRTIVGAIHMKKKVRSDRWEIFYLMSLEVKRVGSIQRLATKEKPISVITTMLN